MLLLFIFLAGINAYREIPKELFPDVTLNMIGVSGSYAGSSAKILDKMAVRDIEESIEGISGIKTTETVIVPGRFDIILTLNDDADPIDVLSKVKDAITASRQYLPPDMSEPVATHLTRKREVLSISLSSDRLDKEALVEAAKDMKRKIMQIDNIAEVKIYGDSDEEILIKIDSRALKAFGLSSMEFVNAVSNLSYIYPVGDIEEPGEFVYLSTVHGKGDLKGWQEALVSVEGKYLRLGDVAQVSRQLAKSSTLSSFNGRENVSLKVYKDAEGDAIALSKKLHHFVESYKKGHPEIFADIYHDSSRPIKKRLDVIISNILIGLVLIFVTMALLINFRIAAIVTLGIPFSFAIGLLFLYYAGYTINIVSLLGALIVIGIVVDDAVVVAENIQRYMEEGLERRAAVLKGLKDMLLPVTLATVTTVAAFIPLFMLSDEISRFIILIPVVVVAVLIGSLIESFLFLPLHAEEFLKREDALVDWRPIQNLYERSLRFVVSYKKVFLTLFLVAVPLSTALLIKHLHFQFFPSFDSTYIYVTGKLGSDTPIEKSAIVAKEMEREILKHKDELGLKSVSATVGSRTTLGGENEKESGSIYITLELYDFMERDFVNRYLNPIFNLSFNFDDPMKRRELKTYELAKPLSKIIEPFKERYGFEELGVRQRHVGVVRNDIKINFSGADEEAVVEQMRKIKRALAAIEGVTGVSDNLKFGKMEYKLAINEYGERLGFSEGEVARLLSAYFLQRREALTFGSDGVVEIRTEDLRKDSISELKDFELPLKSGGFVKLSDVAEFKKSRDYAQIKKRNGETVKTVFASVDKHLTTANDVIEKISPLLKEAEEGGVKVTLLGEKEKNRQLAKEMKSATMLALFLILIALLLIFSKIKYALMVMSVIPFSILGALAGHTLLGINLSMASIIGILGLAGVVINDGIIMLDFLHGTHDAKRFFDRAKLRLRPILITSITTFLGLSTLIFFATGQAVILQPIAVSIGFGLLWGTLLNLYYLPTLYAVINGIADEKLKTRSV
ncbi:MAG: efflux RND transporter permease subunit [Hydrogenimonas sp.]|nr:efflux RND transporter permease subunit [Hydrogenimonas sp.]